MYLNKITPNEASYHKDVFLYIQRSFVYLRPKLWNTMPLEIKNAISLQDFKDRLKTLDGPCDCSKWN